MSDNLSYLNDVMSTSHSTVNGSSTSSSSNGVNPSIPSNRNLADLDPILAALKLSASSEDDLSQLDEESINALLAKLDQAEGVTDGLEARLDSLLGELDGMLDGLKSIGAQGSDGVDASGEFKTEQEKPAEDSKEKA